MQIQPNPLPNNTNANQAKPTPAPAKPEAPQQPADKVSLNGNSNSNHSHHIAPWLAGAGAVAAFAALPGIASAAEAAPAAAATAAAAAAPAAAATTAAATTAASTAAKSAAISLGGLFQIGIGVAVIGSFGLMAYNMYKQAHPSMPHATDAGPSTITFDNVAGVPEAKEELSEVVDFLKNPKKYADMGAEPPHGVLLSGPPGVGKTLLAKAVAGEAKVNFMQINGSDFMEKYVGVGAQRVRELFDQAKEKSPCVVFIDEIDAIGGSRSDGGDGGDREQAQTLNALLSRMDGFDTAAGVVVLAATNRPDMLDSALTRSGRFDRKVAVGLPNKEGRLAILAVHAKGKPIADGVDMGLIADRTMGCSGADLANILNEAALMAVREKSDKITLANLSEAIDRVEMGPQMKSRVLNPEEREITAWHEAGHAIISKALPSNGTLEKVTILPRGQACGVTWTVPTDRSMMKKEDLLDRICQAYGGRAAEETHFHHITTGASNDMEKATDIAKGMVMEYGMTDLGQLTYVDPRTRGKGLAPSPETQTKIDAAVKKIMDEQYDRAKGILTTYGSSWDKLATTLLDKEELDKPALDALLGDHLTPGPAPQHPQPAPATATK